MSSKKLSGIILKLGLDTTDVTKNLKELDKSISQSSRELKEIDKALKLDPKNTELLAQKQQVLTETLEKSRKKMEELEALRSKMDKAAANNAGWEEAYKPLGEEIDKVHAKLTKLKAKKEEMDSKLASGEISQDTYAKYRKELEETSAEMAELTQKKEELEKQFEDGHISAEEYRTYRRDLEETGATITKLQTQIALLDNTTGKSSAEFQAAVKDTKEYKQAMSDLAEKSGEAKEKIGELINFAVKLGGALASAAAAAAAAAVKVGMSFDTSMSSVQALSGATGEEFDALREKALEMGATTSKTASEAADALGYMALAGWDTEKMLSGIEPVLRASEAGAMDLATCSDLVTDSMSAMGVSVDELTRYLDVCTAAQSNSNTSLQELLEAYVTAGGSFKNFNASLEESSTLLGILANRGIKGSEAGTALNSILINLIGASGQSSEALEALGVSAYDADGKFIGITETLEQVSEKLSALDDEQRDFFTAKIGGKTQYDTLQALLSGLNEEYDTLLEKVTDSNGALEETAAIMRDNLQGDVTALTSALQDAGVQVSDHFTASLRDAVQEITETIRGLSSEIKSGDLGESLEKIAAAFGKAIKAVAEFAANDAVPAVANFFGFITDHGDGIISVIVGIGSAFAAWKIVGVITSVQKVMTAFNLAMLNGATASAALSKAVLGSADAMSVLGTAAIAAAAAIGKYIASKIDAAAEEVLHQNQLDETTQALVNQAAAYSDNVKAAKENYSEADAAAAVTQEWWQKVQELTDENGRATGSVAELEAAVEQLNNASGLNVEVINGQIQGYSDLCGSMDEYIEKVRNQAKMSYLQDSYGEAVLNIDSVTEQYNEALQKNTEAFQRYRAAIDAYDEATAPGHSGNVDISALAAEAYEAEQEYSVIATRYNELSKLKSDYESVIQEYEDLAFPSDTTDTKSQTDYIREEAEKQGKATAESLKEKAELAEKGVKQTYEDLEASLEELDDKYAIHAVDDDTYWATRKELLENSRYEEDKEWWAYYDEVTEHYDELAETEKAAQEEAAEKQQEAFESSIDDQMDALKRRNELDSSYTEEMMYNDMETIISGLDKQSDIYQNYYDEILSGRKQLSDEMRQQTIEGVQSEIQALQSEYSQMLDEITAEQDSYRSKLLGMVDLYTNNVTTDSEENKSGEFILENLDDIDKAIDEYDRKMTSLESRGAGENLLSYVQGLSGDDEEYFTKMLEEMSDAELKAYSDKYDSIMEKIDEKAEAKYQPQVDALNNGFIEKVKEKMNELTPEMSELGVQAIDGFIAGFTGDSDKLMEAVSEKCDEVLEGFKNGLDINSPSKETESLGEYAAEGFLTGLSEVSGADAAEQFADDFINKMAEKDSELRETLDKVFAGNMADAVSEMNAIAGQAVKLPSFVLPDAAAVKLTGQTDSTGQTESSGDNKELLNAVKNGFEQVAELLSVIINLQSGEQVINATINDNISILLDGDVVTKAVSRRQTAIKRRSGE